MNTELDEIRDDIKEVKRILIGNGKMGVAEMARRAFEYCQWHKTSKNGLLDWAFRIVIMTLIGFVAMKVGIK